MRGLLLAVAVLASIAATLANDKECVQRKLRGLPVHWPNPTDCSSFYRCTNKNVKRELLCPDGKEYNPKTGRCGNKRKGLCKLSLLAPLAETETNPCANEISGTFVADPKSCRDFNICNNNLAYPQTCGAGSYFNTQISACEPDTQSICWENLCVNKSNGSYVPVANDCHSFYVCYKEKPRLQACPENSYFNTQDLNCQPGKCPSEEDTTTTCAPETTTTTTTPCALESETTTTCAPETTTTPCALETETTTTCAPDTTTTTCAVEITTTTTCSAEDITTTLSTPREDDCSKLNCDSSKCKNAKDGFTYPALNTNTGFCVCQQQKPQYRECPTNGVYNETLTICVIEETTEKPSLDCGGGYMEGDFIPNPDNCMLFYICYEGKFVEASCEMGNYYDETIKACMPDSEGKCPDCHVATTNNRNKRSVSEIQLFKCPDGAKTPAVDCDKYYKCVNGHKLLYGCGKDYLFNVTTLTCELDTEHACYLTSKCTEGEKTPNPYYCQKYYECVNGILVEKNCALNDYFDKLTKSCVADTNNICWEKEPCLCPGGYKEGDISPHPKDCNKHYICIDSKQVLFECDEGNYFNNKTLSCELDTKNICKIEKPCVCPGGIEEGELSPHPNDCDKYYICVGGKQILQECGKGNYFNKNNSICEPDVNNECWSKDDECTCPGGYKEGQFSAHPNDCKKYYICHDKQQILQDCGLNNYFNKDTLTCEPDIYHICWPNLCDGKNNGDMVANPEQCNAFYLCENGKAIPQSCKEGQMFSTKYRACVVDLEAKCYNPCENETAEPIVLLPHPQCNKYYFCNGGKTYVGKCKIGGFNRNKGVCDPNETCIPKTCEGVKDTTLFADPFNPKQFYVCSNGKLIKVGMCDPGEEFNAEKRLCRPVSNPDCPICLKEGNFETLNGDNTTFCVCNKDRISTKIECPKDYVYNSEVGSCYSNAACDPHFCLYNEDNSIAPTRNDTKSFCLCVQKTPIIINCINGGTFNPYISKCTQYEMSPQCVQSECFGDKAKKANEVFAPNKPKEYNGFCRCIDKIATYTPCEYGSAFNPSIGACQLAEINCNSYQCRGLDDNTKIPALTTVLGYCECVGGKAKYYNCPGNAEFNLTTNTCDEPICDFSKCSASVPTIPALNSLDHFCDCAHKTVKPCDKGMLYSTTKSDCSQPCKPELCKLKPVNPTHTVVSEINDNSYCSCSKSSATTDYITNFHECNKNYIFDKEKGICVINSAELCGTEICTELFPDLYKAKDTLAGFCYCLPNKLPEYRDCGDGRIFDAESKECVLTAEQLCDVERCAGATLVHPITFAIKNNKYSFCYCSSSRSVMLVNCRDGEIYNENSGLCLPSSDFASCPDDMEIDAKIPNEKTCNQYYVCVDDEMQLRTCPKNHYFDVKRHDCAYDKEGFCTHKSECTCLGTYYENERLEHPYNKHLYYVCKNGVLHEKKCPRHQIYSAPQKQCVSQKRPDKPAPPGKPDKPVQFENPVKYYNPYRGKRSVDLATDHEFGCVENDKRSVPSNCSQYEICINQMWQRKACTNYRYYNPEQKKCLEPRDDFVCTYAKVTTLASCNANRELDLVRGKNCQQYYQCQQGKWRLKTCGRLQYFNERLSSCLPRPQDPMFQCGATSNKSGEELEHVPTKVNCQHLSQRFYADNCAMYLMCLDNDWWYQYCPPGMFFNRSLNYCVPDAKKQCPQTLIAKESLPLKEEFSHDSCQQDGLLRPSALACNRYFVCVNGKWQMQHCAAKEFYDIANAKCSHDIEGVCSNLNKDCVPNERRSVARNCTSYEQCSQEGKWLKLSCKSGELYDDILQQCVNDKAAICSVHGLKRSCRSQETLAVSRNCSEFYYCSMDTWKLGSCLKDFMYSQEKQMCVAHDPENKCKPLRSLKVANENEREKSDKQLCRDQVDGTSVAHPLDCTRYYICIQGINSQEMQCSQGSYFEPSLGYCRPNDGSCRLPLSGACANATEGDLVPHATDCQAYHKCSYINGSELLYCPQGQYYNHTQKQCLIDHGECKHSTQPKQKCSGLAHGTRLPHELYCNIFYACVKGLAIPVECPNNYQFNAILGKCIYDKDHICQDGHLVEGNVTYSCGNLTDGSYIPDRKDCTRYYICSQGQALPKKCANSTYFNSELLLCVPDDGSCPYVNDNEQNNPVIPDAKTCEGKHGYLMIDPFNCNNFYACVHNKLKHERCYEQQFFNTTTLQCQPKPVTETTPNTNVTNTNIQLKGPEKSRSYQCLDETTSIEQLCAELSEGTSVAEPGDCRRYITCQEANEEPISQRCRNGESFDSLLGFCRQNDGTCLLENGQRVGECSNKHGQLARDASNCRNYFVCINGQKIAQTCADDEYFSKSQNMCIKDTQNVCNPAQPPEETFKQSCAGLSESILYPYIHDNCRSYFQCIKGEAKIHKCADDLYFDPLAIKCVKNKTDCVMPTISLQRSPAFSQTFTKLCKNKKLEYPYPNLDNECRSFYRCHANGDVSHELCPLGMMFNKEFNICMTDTKIICK